MSTKICSSCKEKKSLEAFHNRTNRSSGKYSQCRECNQKRVNQWRKQNRQQVSTLTRRSYLKKTYGITEEQYNELLQKQNECCAVCIRHASEFNKRLAIDHDHHTGLIRGLLCIDCNRHLIGRRRDPELFRSAALYLGGPFTDWIVPPRPKKRRKKKN